MTMRYVVRGFKSWAQYRAESLGTTEEKLLEMRENIKKGPFEEWKHQCETSDKLKFILDHCNADEQKVYLKEFSTEDLGKFLLKEVRGLSKSDYDHIFNMKIRRHRLFGIDGIYRAISESKLRSDQASGKFTNEEFTWNKAKVLIRDKLDELKWREMDSEIASSKWT